MIKERKPEIKPCERSGEDNAHLRDSRKFCRLLSEGLCSRSFLNPTSEGFKQDGLDQMSFRGCQSLEEDLVEESLVRYTSKEVSGLEVLFLGTEAIEDFRSEIFNTSNFYCDIHDHESNQNDRVNNETFMKESKFIRRSIEEIESDTEAAGKIDELSIDQASIVPRFMELQPGLMADIWGNQPEDLFHSTLIKLWSQNFFKDRAEDEKATAYAMMKFHYPKNFVNKYWDGSKNSTKAKMLKSRVRYFVNREMSEIFKRFKEFEKTASEIQYKVFRTEHTRANKNISQKERALSIGLKLDNYKYHLKRCEQILFKVYPEFEKAYRRERNIQPNEGASQPMPLYKIIDGRRIEIPHPAKSSKQLSRLETFKIKKWAFEMTYNKDSNLKSVPDLTENPTFEEKLEDLFESTKYEEVI